MNNHEYIVFVFEKDEVVDKKYFEFFEVASGFYNASKQAMIARLNPVYMLIAAK